MPCWADVTGPAQMLFRTALLVVGLLALAYLSLCILMALRQRDYVYYPQFTRVPASETDFAIERDGVTLRGWRVNAGQRDALIYFGGNAEEIGHMRERLARWFPRRTGYLVAYRGYGASDGTPDEQALTGDAVALFDAVRARHPDGRIAVIGRSLGTGVASHVASVRPVERLVLVTPFDSLAAVAESHMPWLPVDWLLRERHDAARRLAHYRGPVLVVRAGRDTVIPAASTQRLIEALPQPPTVLELADADHDTVDAQPGFEPALRAFLR